MRELPLDTGLFHLIGIGGIGMSGIAEILHSLGYLVQGSDISNNYNTKRLSALGIKVHIGHSPSHVENARVIVVSSAICDNNPEIIEARKRRLPIVKRAEMLGELMRLKWGISIAGTHGKTTTTSLVAHLLDQAKLDPTIISGGILNSYQTNARLGKSDWMVVEADESDGTMVKLPSAIGVVTNIDPEHLDFYHSFEELQSAFLQFMRNIPFYGFGVLCGDHPVVQHLFEQLSDKRVYSYGFKEGVDVKGTILRRTPQGSFFSVDISSRLRTKTQRLDKVFLPMLGDHNVQNALAAICIGLEIGIKASLIIKALGTFAGVKRRFTKIGEAAGMTIIDDYGHHPVEISAVLQAAKNAGAQKIIAVVQPHRYSRVQSLYAEFCRCFFNADCVIVTDIYPAGEVPIPGIDREYLVTGIKAQDHPCVISLEDENDLAETLSDIGQPGDIIICLGAGSISAWAHHLPEQLAKLCEQRHAQPAQQSLSHEQALL